MNPKDVNTFTIDKLQSEFSEFSELSYFKIPIDHFIRNSEIVPIDKCIGIINSNRRDCFMNTALQFLYSIEFFRDYYLKINPDKLDEISLAIKILFILMYTKKNEDPVNLNLYFIKYNEEINSLWDILTFNKKPVIGGNNFADRNQHDSFEYFNILLNKLFENDIVKKNNLSKLIEISGIEIGKCDKTDQSNLYSNFILGKPLIYINLSIPIDKSVVDYNLQDFVDNYFNEELLDNGLKSEFCKTLNPKSICYKKQVIPFFYNYNRYLIINIKRFEYNTETGEYIKVNNKIKLNKDIRILDRNYRLVSCVSHSGNTVNSGHYVLHKFDNNGDYLCEINDRRILIKGSIDYEECCWYVLYRLIETSLPIDRHIPYLEGLPEDLNIKKLVDLNLWDTNRYKLKDINLSLITFAPETIIPERSATEPEYLIPEITNIISNTFKNKCTKSRNSKKYLLYKDDIYFNKYLHYKNKYLKFKNHNF
jgi:uncharacterized UBP type Zn finger protein